jgi:hypothetical protein
MYREINCEKIKLAGLTALGMITAIALQRRLGARTHGPDLPCALAHGLQVGREGRGFEIMFKTLWSPSLR